MPDTNAVAPWGAETRSSCGGGDLVLVDEFAEHIVPSDGGGLRDGIIARRDPASFTPGDGISVFAPLYIFAQAIERFIEPFSSYLGSAAPDDNQTSKKKKADALHEVNKAIVRREPGDCCLVRTRHQAPPLAPRSTAETRS